MTTIFEKKIVVKADSLEAMQAALYELSLTLQEANEPEELAEAWISRKDKGADHNYIVDIDTTEEVEGKIDFEDDEE